MWNISDELKNDITSLVSVPCLTCCIARTFTTLAGEAHSSLSVESYIYTTTNYRISPCV